MLYVRFVLFVLGLNLLVVGACSETSWMCFVGGFLLGFWYMLLEFHIRDAGKV